MIVIFLPQTNVENCQRIRFVERRDASTRRFAECGEDCGGVRIGPRQHLAGGFVAWVFTYRGTTIFDEAIKVEHGFLIRMSGVRPGYTPKVKRLPVFQSMSRSGISARILVIKARPVQCIGITTSGASAFNSATVCST